MTNPIDADFRYFLPFSESGQILGGFSVAWHIAADVVLAHRARTGEDGIVAEYEYSRMTDTSDWKATRWRSRDYRRLAEPTTAKV